MNSFHHFNLAFLNTQTDSNVGNAFAQFQYVEIQYIQYLKLYIKIKTIRHYMQRHLPLFFLERKFDNQVVFKEQIDGLSMTSANLGCSCNQDVPHQDIMDWIVPYRVPGTVRKVAVTQWMDRVWAVFRDTLDRLVFQVQNTKEIPLLSTNCLFIY